MPGPEGAGRRQSRRVAPTEDPRGLRAFSFVTDLVTGRITCLGKYGALLKGTAKCLQGRPLAKPLPRVCGESVTGPVGLSQVWPRGRAVLQAPRGGGCWLGGGIPPGACARPHGKGYPPQQPAARPHLLPGTSGPGLRGEEPAAGVAGCPAVPAVPETRNKPFLEFPVPRQPTSRRPLTFTSVAPTLLRLWDFLPWSHAAREPCGRSMPPAPCHPCPGA